VVTDQVVTDKGKAITNKLLTAGTEKPMEIVHQTPAGTVTRATGKEVTLYPSANSRRKAGI
jgi:hypothetical protein